MPLNYSENRQNIEEKKEKSLREEVEKLKKLLDVKEKELKSTVKKASLKEEILLVREKLKSRRIEYEKIRETKEDKEQNETPDFVSDQLTTKRQFAPTSQQVKVIAKQTSDADIQHQLTILVNLTLTKSIYYAVKTAKKIGNAYLLDRFHDLIVNELYEDLVKKKKIKSTK